MTVTLLNHFKKIFWRRCRGEIIQYLQNTFLYSNEKVIIMDKNKKLVKTIEISEIVTLADNNSYSKIIKITGYLSWLLVEGIPT